MAKTTARSATTIKYYLLFYNLVLAILWLQVLVETIKTGNFANVYEKTFPTLMIAQTAAVMEIVHAFFGLVKSPVILTFFQVFSRIWTFWAVLVMTPETRKANVDFADVIGKVVKGGKWPLKSSSTFLSHVPLKMGVNVKTLCIAWGITEVVRYSFYFFKLLSPKSGPPKVLVWLRYSLFLVLYPLGVASELALAYASIGPLGKSKKLDVLQMPNAMNVSLHGPTLMRVFMSCYMPVWPLLFSYMLKQRGKVLGGAASLRKRKTR